jgi:hypothetical protein
MRYKSGPPSEVLGLEVPVGAIVRNGSSDKIPTDFRA